MRLHAFGSLCVFLMTSFFVLLDNCLMRLDVFFFASMRFPAEIPAFCCILCSNIRVSKVTTMECE